MDTALPLPMPETRQQPPNVITSASTLAFVSFSWKSTMLKSMMTAGEVYSRTPMTLRLVSCIPEK